jgi:hypothetical protein
VPSQRLTRWARGNAGFRGELTHINTILLCRNNASNRTNHVRDGKHGNTCDVENCFEQVIDDFSSNISELRRPDKEDLDLHSFKAELIYIALWGKCPGSRDSVPVPGVIRRSYNWTRKQLVEMKRCTARASLDATPWSETITYRNWWRQHKSTATGKTKKVVSVVARCCLSHDRNKRYSQLGGGVSRMMV